MKVGRNGKFSLTISGEKLSKGLRTSKRNKRNDHSLTVLSGSVGQDEVLAVLEELDRIDTSELAVEFPYPQLFVLINYILVCTATNIYEYSNGVLTSKLNVEPGDPWRVLDFYDYIYMSNAVISVTRDAITREYSLSDLPPANAMCNFNGQVLIGPGYVPNAVPGKWVAALAQLTTNYIYLFDSSLKAVVQIELIESLAPANIVYLETEYTLDTDPGAVQKGGYCINKSGTTLWYLLRTDDTCQLVEVDITAGVMTFTKKTNLTGLITDEVIMDGCADDTYTYWCTDLLAGRIIKIRNSDHTVIDNHEFTLDLLGHDELNQGIEQIDVLPSTGKLFWNYELASSGPTVSTAVWIRSDTDFTIEVTETWSPSAPEAFGHDLLEIHEDYVMQHNWQATDNMIVWGDSPNPQPTDFVILDITDNWGDPNHIGIRSIDFYYSGSKLDILQATFSAAATTIDNGNQGADRTFDITQTKTGSEFGAQWLTTDFVVSNQRIYISFNTPQTFDKIVINNSTHSGSYVTRGARNTKIYRTNPGSSWTPSTVFNETIPDSTLLFDGELAIHIDDDIEDEQTSYDGVTPVPGQPPLGGPSYDYTNGHSHAQDRLRSILGSRNDADDIFTLRYELSVGIFLDWLAHSASDLTEEDTLNVDAYTEATSEWDETSVSTYNNSLMVIVRFNHVEGKNYLALFEADGTLKFVSDTAVGI
jgi:hypothetical protein